MKKATGLIAIIFAITLIPFMVLTAWEGFWGASAFFAAAILFFASIARALGEEEEYPYDD